MYDAVTWAWRVSGVFFSWLLPLAFHSAAFCSTYTNLGCIPFLSKCLRIIQTLPQMAQPPGYKEAVPGNHPTKSRKWVCIKSYLGLLLTHSNFVAEQAQEEHALRVGAQERAQLRKEKQARNKAEAAKHEWQQNLHERNIHACFSFYISFTQDSLLLAVDTRQQSESDPAPQDSTIRPHPPCALLRLQVVATQFSVRNGSPGLGLSARTGRFPPPHSNTLRVRHSISSVLFILILTSCSPLQVLMYSLQKRQQNWLSAVYRLRLPHTWHGHHQLHHRLNPLLRHRGVDIPLFCHRLARTP